MVNINIKNEAKSLVSEYSSLFVQLEELEIKTKELNLEKDRLLSKLDELREREKSLIDNIGDNKNVTLIELLS